MDAVERNFPDTDSVDIKLFARMMLLGKLFEIALANRIGTPVSTIDGVLYERTTIVVSLESERLAQIVQRILQQHSDNTEVTETRLYKHLQLLIIDHEVIRDHKAEDACKAMIKIMPRLVAIEDFASSPEVVDHQLSLDIIYHLYIFLPRKEWRKTMSRKMAHFIRRFGPTHETWNLQSSIYNDQFSSFCHPTRTYMIWEVIKLSEAIKTRKSLGSDGMEPRTRQSILETILRMIEDQVEQNQYLSDAREPSNPYPRHYIASTAADPDTIQLPARPKKVSKSTVIQRRSGSVDSSSSG
ncbi:hypothetical protein E4T48_02217 [Aureobasidium sp. EXF-10727]|nr:hypothetical protein E4T48_02217 [Aureobasidium sp. EXF-10727]